jgi:phosphatidylserine/phosphatidylglycerophosphate/cardiolipin synthase-like enzyme
MIIENAAYYDTNWADAMRLDVCDAKRAIMLTALSLHVPRSFNPQGWPGLWWALCDAVDRDVAVDVYLPAPMEHNPATQGNHTAGRLIEDSGMHIHYIVGNRLLHAKTLCIDGRVLWVGSGNFTAAAAHHNHEAYLRCTSAALCDKHIHRFLALR